MECKYLKLSSGENLIVQLNESIEDNDKKYLEVTEPVLISPIAVPFGKTYVETYVMQPWARMAKQGTVKINMSSIVATMELSEKAEVQYKEFIVEYNEKMEKFNSEQTEMPSDDDVLDLFFGSDESDDEEEENDSGTSTTDRTYH